MINWDEEMIQRYIDNQIEENLNLDYKGAGSISKSSGKKREMSKDVTAMANSDGGLIIYGVREYDELDKNHLPHKIDPINRKEFPKEWIEQIINSNISPRIQGIKIIPIELNSGEHNVVYVIEIPKGETAHQAADFRYYRRFNFESIPMYDYEIRDVMNRNKTPILDINVAHECEQIEKKNLLPLPDLSLMTNSNKTLKEKEYWEHFRLHFKVKNVGNLIAKFIKVKIKVPDIILKESEYQFNEKEIIDEVVYKIIFLDNTVRDVIDTDYSLPLHPKIKYGSRRFSPLLPELEFGEYILLKEKHILPTGKIFWKIYVDNSIPKEGEMNMEEIENKSL